MWQSMGSRRVQHDWASVLNSASSGLSTRTKKRGQRGPRPHQGPPPTGAVSNQGSWLGQAPPTPGREAHGLSHCRRHFELPIVTLRHAGVSSGKAGLERGHSTLSPARLCHLKVTLSTTYLCWALCWVLSVHNRLKSPQPSWNLEGESVSPLDALTNNNMKWMRDYTPVE